MLKRFVWLLCFFFPVFLHASIFGRSDPLSEKAKRAQKALEELDALVEKALEDYQVPGIAIGVVVDGHLVYSKGFGTKEIGQKAAVTPNTLFAIGSCTKAFTSFVAGNLFDEGLMLWDDAVVDILPGFRLWDQYATQNLTIRDLLTHRSGLPRHDFMWYNSSASRLDLLKRIRYLEPSYDIRERYQYNNLMYLAAGCAMEQVTGKSWEELVSEKILKPLEMKKTNFSVLEMKKSDNFALPHIEKRGVVRKIPLRDLSAMGPVGSMNSNISDLSHWVQMQLNQGVYDKKTLISPSTLQEMHAPQVIIPGTPECKEALIYAYGIGWGITAYRGNYYVSHDGGIDGFTALVGLLPNDGVGLIVLANKNLTTLPRYLSFEIIDRVLELEKIDWLKEGRERIRKSKEAFKETTATEDRMRKKGTHPSHPLEDYAGEYEHLGYGKMAVELVDGKLQATFNGITSILDHWHYDVFTVSEDTQDLIVSLEGTKLTFQTNLEGDIDQLMIPLEPNSTEIAFKKRPLEKLSTLSYLRQFVGLYEIYGYTVEIAIRDNALCAIIPGQPIYQLVSSGEGEFTVKSMFGYTVRFIMNAMNSVEEILLVAPYGAFSATPKH